MKVKIKIARTAMWSIGTKNWYVIQSEDGTRYQRWSHLMDLSDEVIMLAREGDQLELEVQDMIRGGDYVIDIVTAKFVDDKA